jgi:hypothetical protein
VFAFATHGLLNGPAVERIEASVLERVYVANTVPLHEQAAQCAKIEVVSVGPTIGEAIKPITAKIETIEMAGPTHEDKPTPESKDPAVQAILKRLMRPHYGAFVALVNNLMAGRAEMTPWERDTFLPDIARKMTQAGKISPAMVKKVREIAHKYGVSIGFPSFAELGAAYDEQQDAERKRTASAAQEVNHE